MVEEPRPGHRHQPANVSALDTTTTHLGRERHPGVLCEILGERSIAGTQTEQVAVDRGEVMPIEARETFDRPDVRLLHGVLAGHTRSTTQTRNHRRGILGTPTRTLLVRIAYGCTMTKRVICIARLSGAGGDEVGQKVANALGYQLVDEEIIQRAAEAEGISVDELSEVERRSSVLTRLLRSLAMSGGADGGMMGVATPPPMATFQDPKSLRALIQRSIHETAAQGKVVIVSHAASFALADRPDVLRVLVTASHDVRVARVQAGSDLEPKKVEKAVDDDDAGRADYLKQFYGVARELPTHYDLVLNSDNLSADTIAFLVVGAANAG
jgi:cytidylate kinase